MSVSGPPQRVQSLLECGLSDLPSQYIQPPETRPGSCRQTSDASVPVIDLFQFDQTRFDDVRQSIGRACQDWGAFQVINHGIPERLLDDIRSAGRSFFDAPMEDKMKYVCDPNSAASEGYGSRMLAKDDGVLDWRDYFDHHTLPETRRNPGKWPDFPPYYREVVVEYSNHMKKLARKLLQFISEDLSLPPSYIEDAVGEAHQNITISFYPPCPQPDLALGLQSHSDMGAVTLLIQDAVGGLEVLKDDGWVLVQPLPKAIVVIIADQTEIMSNGECRSCVHRAVVNGSQPRLSVATFYDPSKTTKISPAAQLVTHCSPAKYREVIYGDYVSAWYTKGPDGKRNIDTLRI
ncbi:jasmonate-induced oxygenase 4 [Aristolochia californica]|uniref:jasmonate-induced oxygenase 4 n=1 Tax=Aristolochia californica TaxID=171875 RepID=UPI0035E34608